MTDTMAFTINIRYIGHYFSSRLHVYKWFIQMIIYITQYLTDRLLDDVVHLEIVKFLNAIL